MTASTQEHSIVAIYDSHTGAEAALKELQKAGLDMKRLSIIGKDFHTEEHALGFYTSGDRMKFWGQNGAFWGSLWGILFGSAFFVLPGVGRLVFQAISNRDLVVVRDVVMLLAAVVVLVNFVVDLLYALVDPRLRHSS